MKKFNIDEYILQNYKNKTNAQMALECGCNKSTISNHRKKLGISATELDKNLRQKAGYICQQYGKKTKTAIAKELNCSISFITKIWRENGLVSKQGLTYTYDESYFQNIDTAQKAYWLGFIAADGCIYRREGHRGMLSISLREDDAQILEHLREDLNTVKPISIQKNKRNNHSMATLQINSDIICNRLLEIGMGVRKPFDLSIEEICSNIPKKFINSFILGYFDGDGSIDIPTSGISKSHIRIAGPLKNLMDFKEILKKFEINSNIIHDNRKYKEPFGSLELENTTEKYIFLKFIYNSSVKCLQRKKERASILTQRIEHNITNRSGNIKAINHYKSVVLKWGELLKR